MRITFDPAKRERTLRERGLDFAAAAEVFAAETIDILDLRRDYGERRINSVGFLRGRMVIICWTPRGDARHVISMRKANDREKARFGQRHGEG
ncbi:MAG TPA: BrnT family toxin [Pseudolabrys sp.]|nr:BrnT family toxin [Pseudolabrys sp.]